MAENQNSCNMADSKDGDLKTFLENVLNKTESLICEEHTVITSNLLLHLDPGKQWTCNNGHNQMMNKLG